MELSAAEGTKKLVQPLARTVIVGGAGEVGRMVRRVIGPAVGWVEIVDLEARPWGRDPRCTCSRSDVMRWVEREGTLLRRADCVVLAVPEEVALRAVEPLAQRMPEDALLVDTLSVKGPIVSRLRRLPLRLEKLSLNPMFAPSLDLRDQAVLAVEVSAGPRARLFLELFRSAGGRVVPCGAEEHDRATAALQGLTHATLLGFGAALRELDGDAEQLLRIAPPPFVALLALLARVLSGNPMTYFDIQASNRCAGEARAALARANGELGRAVDGGPAAFAELLSSLAELLSAEAGQLERQAQRLLETVRGEAGSANGGSGIAAG
ncbi:MAG: prephenate dehydrogenase dimerization domain-containing protein [Solirubrobacterales bacterium]